MTFSDMLAALRQRLAHWWIVAVFGVIYVISQATIGALLGDLGPELGRLQVTGFNAEYYLDTFRHWQATGRMPLYEAHFLIDGIHWLWYTLLLLALLSLALNGAGASRRGNVLLMLPLVAGPCDALENSIQHIFLNGPGYATVVDPLPLISTLASISKWSLVVATLVALMVLTFRALRGEARS